MGRRSLRNTTRGTNAVAGSIPERIASVPTASGDASIGDTGDAASADGNNQHVEREPDNVNGVSYVEVDPERIAEYIAGTGTDTGTDSGSGERRTRRSRSDAGKPRGTRKRKETPQNLDAVVTMIHTWASVLLKTPELMLDPDEAKKLSESYATFCDHHEVPMLTAKRMSEINLIATVGMMYLPRIIAIGQRRKHTRHMRTATKVVPIVEPIGHVQTVTM